MANGWKGWLPSGALALILIVGLTLGVPQLLRAVEANRNLSEDFRELVAQKDEAEEAKFLLEDHWFSLQRELVSLEKLIEGAR